MVLSSPEHLERVPPSAIGHKWPRDRVARGGRDGSQGQGQTSVADFFADGGGGGG